MPRPAKSKSADSTKRRWFGVPPKPAQRDSVNSSSEGTRQAVSEAKDNTAGFVLANGSMSSNQSGEGDIRRALIETDFVDTALRDSALPQSEATPQVLSKANDNMVALPGQLFYSTQIPVCLWFLAKNKNADAKRGFRDRRKQTLFIDARKLGTLIGAGVGNHSLN